MHIENVRLLNIGNSQIEENFAKDYGGGVNFVCPEDDSGIQDCKLILTDTTISNNEANEGGGIRFLHLDIDFTNSIISGNRAKLYGNDFASFAT